MRKKNLIFLSAVLFICATRPAGAKVKITGELKRWHDVVLTFEGPVTNELAVPNPFMDYRLDVTFAKGGKRFVVPGYYCADGRIDQTGMPYGNKWRVHFRPCETGVWTYAVSFRRGPYAAVSGDPQAGEEVSFDGLTGTIEIADTDKTGRDFRGKGRLEYVGERYLKFAGTGEYFLKAGADSPENFLAYYQFDGTSDHDSTDPRKKKTLHRYSGHLSDWKEGDPFWKEARGKSIIGAVNYLASKGMNSIYFVTMNVNGDGKDVWPWTDYDQRLRFDCGKLGQWGLVLSHMEKLGIMMHVVTQETENDHLLDGGELGPERKLYYRELIARFGHHLGVVWNLGEENVNSDAQRKAFASFFKDNDPWGSPVVLHTYPGKYDQVYGPMLGYPDFDGPSLQMNETGSDTHSETVKWVTRSGQAGRQWFVCLDEYGHGKNGVKPDSVDPAHDQARVNCLWGNLMAGGAGCEWYFGYEDPNNDLNCEDWRSRDKMWDLTRYAVGFFHEYLPFWEMEPADSLVSRGWCLAKGGEIYAVYLPEGGEAKLDLPLGDYSVKWYNPRKAGGLQNGSVGRVAGAGEISLGKAPAERNKDWVILVRRQ